MRESDRQWELARDTEGWTLPEPSWPVARLWGIRHVRWIIDTIIVHREATAFGKMGIGSGYPNPYDEWVLWAIRRGWV